MNSTMHLFIMALHAALASPVELRDAGRPALRPGPVALVVVSPGIATHTYQPMVLALEAQGLDAWTLSFPITAQHPESIVQTWLPEAAGRFRDRGLVIVAEGLGGLLVAESVAGAHTTPDALALLGVPVHMVPVELSLWLAALPIPALGLQPATLTRATWQGHPVIPLLLGAPPPDLEPVSADWLSWLADRVKTHDSIALDGLDLPIWAGMGGLDNLAPPETMHTWCGDATYVRFGYDRLDPIEYDHAALLTDPRPLDVLARWASRVMRHTP